MVGHPERLMSLSGGRSRIVTCMSLVITRERPPQPTGPEEVASRSPDAVAPASAESSTATLSPSRASNFKQCPRLFRYRSIDRLPEPPSVYQARGTTAHLALDYLFDLPAEQRTAQRLFDLFREAWTGLRADPEYSGLFETLDDERAWGIESLGVLANYLTLENPVAVTPLGKELDMTEKVGEIVIRGILDRLDERPDGQLMIVDYKTGRAPPERYALPAFFALKIYALLVRRRFGRTPAELRLMYLGNSTVYSIGVDDRVLDGMERQLAALAEAIERAIERDHFPPRPSVLCKWCSFQQICPAFGDMQDDEPSRRPPPVPVALAG